MEIVIFIGIQATGKSSFFKSRFADTHVRINLDMLRTRHRERCLFQACLESSIPCVIDNTNVTKADRSPYVEMAREAGIPIVGYFFKSVLGDALDRNRMRSGRERIPDLGLRNASTRLELPTLDEGFDNLYFVSLPGQGFCVDEWH